MKNYELAEKIGTSESFVSMLLAGKRRPSWNIAKKIAKETNSNVKIWMETDIEEMKKAIRGNGK